jgi:putative hydrolase of the HAD superfamily
LTVWLFDLDNTLYPASCGLFDLVSARISEYMAVRVGLPQVEIPELRRRYWVTYGLTLGGLVAHHGVDAADYLAYVHDVPLGDFLGADPQLGAALEELPGEKFVFTNGSRAHAGAVLSCLGVDRHISDIFDIAFIDYVPKPRPHGFRKVLGATGAQPAFTWMVDDSRDNLDTAAALGLRTVLVGEEPDDRHLHARLPTDLPDLFRERRDARAGGVGRVDSAPCRRV